MVAITQNYSYKHRRWAEWENDFNIAEREQLRHSAVGGWQISFFPLPLSQSLSLTLYFCLFHFFFSFFLILSVSFHLLLFPTHFLIPVSFFLTCAHTHTDVYTELHTRESSSGNTFQGILVQGILMGPFHISALLKKKEILTCCALTEWNKVCVCFYSMSWLCPHVTTSVAIQRLGCKSCHWWVRIKVRRVLLLYLKLENQRSRGAVGYKDCPCDTSYWI